MARTATATTGGLERFFEEDSFLGFKANPTAILAVSVILSLFSAILTHIKTLVAEKGFLRIKQKISVFCWILFASIRRIMTFITFFTPSLGLFNILYHWKAETYPFKFRINAAKRLNVTPSFDAKIVLFNMTETVYWSKLDRWDYSDPQHPTPPSYKLYTGMSLKEYFGIFFVILSMQCFSFMVVKFWTSEDFKTNCNIYEKFIHLLENVNFPVPYRDWDQGSHSVAEFRRRYSNTEREMIGSFVVTIFYTSVMFIPLFYTGVAYLINSIAAFIHNPYSVFNINRRHQFLNRLIETKPEENVSLAAANNLAIAVTILTILVFALEVTFYFILNRIVRVK